MHIFQVIHTNNENIDLHLQHLFSYILINHQVESIAPCWEDVVLQRCGTVVGVDDMAWLQKHERSKYSFNEKEGTSFLYQLIILFTYIS